MSKDITSHTTFPKCLCVAEDGGKVRSVEYAYTHYDKSRFRELWEARGCTVRFNGIRSEDCGPRGVKVRNGKIRVAGRPVLIYCVETAETFRSVEALRRSLPKISRWALDIRIKNHMPIYGKHYEIIRK